MTAIQLKYESIDFEDQPGANVTQVAVDNSFCSRITYVKSAAVPPPKECPTICHIHETNYLLVCAPQYKDHTQDIAINNKRIHPKRISRSSKEKMETYLRLSTATTFYEVETFQCCNEDKKRYLPD